MGKITHSVHNFCSIKAKLVGSDTYTQVPFIPDTVLVLVGDMLQRLTNDQFVAVVSLALFVREVL